MIKVVYYIGTCDKDTLKPELSNWDFIKVFDELFINYTLQKAQGVYTMQDTKKIIREYTFIVTTLLEPNDFKAINEIVFDNIQILKDRLNQESILVEVSKPSVMFL